MQAKLELLNKTEIRMEQRKSSMPISTWFNANQVPVTEHMTTYYCLTKYIVLDNP
jgi:hypothetical protein